MFWGVSQLSITQQCPFALPISSLGFPLAKHYFGSSQYGAPQMLLGSNSHHPQKVRFVESCSPQYLRSTMLPNMGFCHWLYVGVGTPRNGNGKELFCLGLHFLMFLERWWGPLCSNSQSAQKCLMIHPSAPRTKETADCHVFVTVLLAYTGGNSFEFRFGAFQNWWQK